MKNFGGCGLSINVYEWIYLVGEYIYSYIVLHISVLFYKTAHVATDLPTLFVVILLIWTEHMIVMAIRLFLSSRSFGDFLFTFKMYSFNHSVALS